MTGPLIALGSALFFLAVVLAVRAQGRRQVVTASAYATTGCMGCGATIQPGEGGRIRGESYCSDDCARWAW